MIAQPTSLHDGCGTAAGPAPCDSPGWLSSLSSVPPLWPSPRPEIIGTKSPAGRDQRRQHEADVVPDPAGRMLVDDRAGRDRASLQSSTRPEAVMAPRSAPPSRPGAPCRCRNTAIAKAAACSPVTVPAGQPRHEALRSRRRSSDLAGPASSANDFLRQHRALLLKGVLGRRLSASRRQVERPGRPIDGTGSRPNRAAAAQAAVRSGLRA